VHGDGALVVLILGVETATHQVSVAIGGHEGVLALFEVCRGRRHAETLAPAIQFVCQQAQIEMSEISVLAVDIGPGLFTGMRVGLATAKAIAQALRLPMIGISSLDLLAFPLRHSGRAVAAIIDARKGEVFWALYRPVPGGVQRIGEPMVGSPDDLVADLMASGHELLCVGDGALRYRDQLATIVRCEVADQFLSNPSAAPLVQLAHARALREEWVNPWEVQPLYLRPPDAQINWSMREGGR
jgi:tRNA threonylcarbamoyladenosine biosynthesis protein TsaB